MARSGYNSLKGSSGQILIKRQTGMAPQQKTCTLVGGVFVLICVYLVYQMTSSSPEWFDVCPSEDFVLALTQHATPDRFILLALVDAAFADMAINLYESSLKPFGIENFLFVGAGQRACEILSNVSLPCFHYTEDKDNEVPSTYRSPDFIRKMNIRTDMILDALSVGFTVLHTDLDVSFLKNPIPDLREIMTKADIATLWDSVAYNAGFVVVRPTWFSKQIYKEMKSMTRHSDKVDDQTALNSQISRMNVLYRFRGFSAVALNNKRYLCGVDYFEKDRRFFAANCSDCIVVHNNWIVGREAKVYRFKEHLLWMYDKDSYYTNTSQDYLIYSNPIIWSNDKVSVLEELDALKAALAIGQLLNRIVILPHFHCTAGALGIKNPTGPKVEARGRGGFIASSKAKDVVPRIECPLNGLLNVTAFDAMFADRYRESSFLRHPLVKNKIKTSVSVPHFIMHSKTIDIKQRLSSTNKENESTFRVVHPPASSDRLTDADIIQLFGNSTSKVLAFHSLYHTVPEFSNLEMKTDFDNRIKKAFQHGQYRQL